MRQLEFSRIAAYLPPAVFVVLVPLSGFFPHLLNNLGIQYLLGMMGLALIGVGLHLEARYTREVTRLAQLQSKIEGLVHTQTKYLDRASQAISSSTLADGFRRQASIGSRLGTLRVFAISSQQILSFMRFEDFKVDHCMLLLRAFGDSDASHKDFENQIMLAVRDWRRLATEGKITRLTIRSYDFLPTEYQVIFDDRAMLCGLYDSDPSDYSEVSVRQPIYVDGSTTDGRTMIEGYRERFDNLFEKCATHHGPDRYAEFCHDPEKKKATP